MSKGGPTPVRIDPSRFEWPEFHLIGLEHPTFAWFDQPNLDVEVEAIPLTDRAWGARDSLSILAQYAAHESMLYGAGLAEFRFDPEEWLVSTRRDHDVRLVRLCAARGNLAEVPSPLSPATSAFECARHLGVTTLSCFDVPWQRPDAIYVEAFAKLSAGAARNLEHIRNAAMGFTLAQPHEVELILGAGATMPADRADELRLVARRSKRALLLDFAPATRSILEPGSGLSAVKRDLRLSQEASDDEVLDSIRNHRGPVVALIPAAETIDRATLNLIRRALRNRIATVLTTPEAAASFHLELSELSQRPSVHVVSPTAESRGRLLRQLERRPWTELRNLLSSFVRSTALDLFLSKGDVPILGEEEVDIPEPARSYLSAVAVAGDEVPISVVTEILGELGSELEPKALEHPPLVAMSNGSLVFSAGVARSLVDSLPHALRRRLGDLAGETYRAFGRPHAAAEAFLRGGCFGAAADLLEQLEETHASNEESADLIRRIPVREIVSRPRLTSIRAADLLRQGRYLTVLRLLSSDGDGHAHLTAASLRRQGRYEDALSHLEQSDGFEATLLRGELLRLQSRVEKATAELDRALLLARTDEEIARARYERTVASLESAGLLADDSFEDVERARPDLSARIETYVAMESGDYEGADHASARAFDLAPDLVARIDAALDRQQVSYLSGDWDEARRRAHQTLSLIEQTENDRAAGGVLFLLGFLSADEGRWREAEILVGLLQSYYEDRRDEARAGEVDLIQAQLELGRLNLDAARSAATRLISGGVSGDIAVAAQLVLGEIAWLQGRSPEPLEQIPSSLELRRRSSLLTHRRRGSAPDHGDDSFQARLRRWELATLRGRESAVPTPASGSESLQLLRSVVGLSARVDRPELETLERSLRDGVEISQRPVERDDDHELELLRQATNLFADPKRPLVPIAGHHWCVAYRNRLGRWIQEGSREISPEHLDRSNEEVREAEGHLVWIENASSLSEATLDSLVTLLRSTTMARRQQRLRAARATEERLEQFEGLIGESGSIRELSARIPRLARSEVPVLITGASGTGKELVARAIHKLSSRVTQPFTPVNCSALPLELAESELFGHARGAFTGADRDRPGLIEATDGGTLFLDEIGEMPLALQAKVLRFLQEGEYRRVGENEHRIADVRIVAATNRNLEKAIDDGSFREDLYYRIAGSELEITPLAERGDDVILLAEHFLERVSSQTGVEKRFAPDVLEAFLAYEWPGNVRELEQAVRAGHAMAGEGELVELRHVYDRITRSGRRRVRPAGDYRRQLDEYRRELLTVALTRAEGNQTRAAKSLGMSRQALSYLVRELGIRLPR